MYYFKFNGHGVGCDSVDELRDALIPAAKDSVVQKRRDAADIYVAGAPLPNPDITPTTTETRARRTKKKGREKTKGNPGASAWLVAKLFAKKKGITPGAARTYLKDHPRAKARFLKTIK